MSIRNFLLQTGNAPRRCLIWLIVFVVMLAFTLIEGAGYGVRTDGPVICLEGDATLRQRFGEDTLTSRLGRGDSLRVLGVDRSSFGQKWLVQTRRGDIGWIDASDLTGIRQIVVDGKDKGDTVAVTARWLGAHIYRYTYTDRNGKECERSTDAFMPALDGIGEWYYDRDAVGGVCTRAKFEKETVGKTFSEINAAFGYPVLLRTLPDGMEAQYSWKTFDPSTGMMWKPNVAFGKDSVARTVEYSNPTKRAAGWLKAMPLAPAVIDCPLTSVMIRTGRYTAFADPMPSSGKKALMICLLVVVLISLFCWTFCTPAIPTLLMGWLMVFPPVFAWLDDKWLRRTIFVVALVSAYVWIIVMMAWGMFPFWSLLILIAGWYAYSLAVSPLCTYPHCRCPKCRHMYTIRYDHEEFDHSETHKGSDIVRGKLLGQRTHRWESWTRVTTKWSDGSVTTHDKDRQTHKDYYDVYQMIDYEVTYRLDFYRQYYRCSCCGHEEQTTRVDRTELDRKAVGSHTQEFFDRRRTW